MTAPSAQRALFDCLIQAYNDRTFDILGNCLTPDYHHVVLPSRLEALGPLGAAKEGRDVYVTSLQGSLAWFESFEVKIVDTVEAADAKKLVAHLTSVGMSTTQAPYENEYMYTVTFKETDEGLQICKAEEFVDSGFSVQFFKSERERQTAKVTHTSTS